MQQEMIRFKASHWSKVLNGMHPKRATKLFHSLRKKESNPEADIVLDRRLEILDELSQAKMPAMSRFEHWKDFSGQQQFREMEYTNERIKELELQFALLERQKETSFMPRKPGRIRIRSFDELSPIKFSEKEKG